MTFLNKDLLAGLSFLLFGLLLVTYLIPVWVDEPRRIQFVVLAPSYYPKLIAFALIVIGSTISIRSLYFKQGEHLVGGLHVATYFRVVAAVATFFATALLLPFAGFVLGSTVFLAILMLLAGERSPTTIALIAVSLPILLYLFFTKLANIPIPGGVLESLLQRI